MTDSGWQGGGAIVGGDQGYDNLVGGRPRAPAGGRGEATHLHRRRQRMAIVVGDRLPDVKVFTFGEKGPVPTGFAVPPLAAASMDGAATYPVCAWAR